jgi:hypothetical protein
MSLGKKLISTDAAGGGGSIVADENFAPSIWTGNNSERKIPLNFAPDFVYVKKRNTGTSGDHQFMDTVRGIGSQGGADILFPAYTLRESTNADANYLKSFDSDGFTIGSNTYFNASPNTYAGWAWKAASSTTSIASGTNGSNVISNVRANQAGGFSIVEFGALGAANSIVSHGLSSAPELIIYKNLDTADNWYVYTSVTGLGKYLNLNLSGQAITNASNGFTSVNANTFTVNLTTNADDTICYCFHSIADYQSIGTYTGSGSAGKRVYTDSNGDGTGTGGFQPRFVLIKCTTNASTEWLIFTSNVVDGSGDPTMLRFTQNEGEFTGDRLQFTSDGFTISDADGSRNGGSRTYLYWAIA